MPVEKWHGQDANCVRHGSCLTMRYAEAVPNSIGRLPMQNSAGRTVWKAVPQSFLREASQDYAETWLSRQSPARHR